MSYPCELLERPAQPVMSIRTHTSVENLPQLLARAYGAIIQHLCEIGEQPSGPAFVGYYNMDMQNLDLEIGFPVGKLLPGKGEVQAGEIPAGDYAACLYTGPYNEMAPAYESLNAFITQQGRKPSGASYEFYLNDPTTTPPPELKTHIFFPLSA